MDRQTDEAAGKSIKSLRALATAEGECCRCLLYRDATQVVPGEGPKQAASKPRGRRRTMPNARRSGADQSAFGGGAVGRCAAFTTPAWVSAAAICCMRLIRSTAATGGNTRRQAG